MRKNFSNSLLVVIAIFLAISSEKVFSEEKREPMKIEISPNKWLEITPSKKHSGYVFEWNGKKVIHPILIDKDGAQQLIFSLREKNGTLYSIMLDRQNIHETKFLFSRLNDEGTGFQRMAAKDYPRDIATENIHLHNLGVVWTEDGMKIDPLDSIKTLDVEGTLVGSITATIWTCLATGKEHFEVKQEIGRVRKKEICLEYKRKHKPVPLPNLVWEEKK